MTLPQGHVPSSSPCTHTDREGLSRDSVHDQRPLFMPPQQLLGLHSSLQSGGTQDERADLLSLPCRNPTLTPALLSLPREAWLAGSSLRYYCLLSPPRLFPSVTAPGPTNRSPQVKGGRPAAGGKEQAEVGAAHS